ncbi:hypothetical protein VZC37_21760 [Gordonia sp. LSe1-13]|uniref:YdhG-like domain-containing protein n=1 Tax=Gordonia sesuvii TaxID=3116777 RepID=A0ABU7MIQ7_9ACTN|nr:hypothetical protein [Gordonia sp. LSe1-13]
MSAQSPEEYIGAQSELAQEWLREFHDYVEQHYPSVPLIMFRGVPMFRFEDSYLKGYVMFTAASRTMSAHAIDFDLVDVAKAKVGGSQPAKGCVKVKYTDAASKPAVYTLIDAVMARHDIPKA